MEIIRIYNNNVAVVRGGDGKEMIVIGKGLAFQKHAGDELEHDKIDKYFTLQNPKNMTKLEELIKNIPTVYLAISEEIVEMIHRDSELKLSESIYITLTDHISLSLEREKNGVVFENPFLLEIKQFYREEFRLASRASDIIRKHLNLVISEHEIGMIALHIVNASMNQNFEVTMRATRMIQDILEMVRERCQMEFDEESLDYNRFIRHLQFLSKRVLSKKREQDNNTYLYQMACDRFPDTIQFVREICEKLRVEYGVTVTEAEQGFLAYHIINITGNHA